jgi:hypothetical protein
MAAHGNGFKEQHSNCFCTKSLLAIFAFFHLSLTFPVAKIEKR